MWKVWQKKFPDNDSRFSWFSVLGNLFFMMLASVQDSRRRFSVAVGDALFRFTLCFWVSLAVALTRHCYLLIPAAFFKYSFHHMRKVQWWCPPLPALSGAFWLPWQSSSACAAFTNQLRTPTHKKMMMRQQKQPQRQCKEEREAENWREGPGLQGKRDNERMRAISLFYALLPNICSSSGSTMSLSRPLPPFLQLSLCCHHSMHFSSPTHRFLPLP